MLVLSRKIGEEVIIGMDENDQAMKLMVTKVVGNRVWLGFMADSEVRIDRKEIWDSKHSKDVTTVADVPLL